MPSVLTLPLDSGLAEHELTWAEDAYTEGPFYRYGSRRVLLTTSAMKVVLEVGNPPLEPLLPNGARPIINGFFLTPCHGLLPALSLCPTCQQDFGSCVRTNLYFLRTDEAEEEALWAMVVEDWEESLCRGGLDPVRASMEVTNICRIIESLHRVGIPT